jgi:uncharacterized low-complexity protein
VPPTSREISQAPVDSAARSSRWRWPRAAALSLNSGEEVRRSASRSSSATDSISASMDWRGSGRATSSHANGSGQAASRQSSMDGRCSVGECAADSGSTSESGTPTTRLQCWKGANRDSRSSALSGTPHAPGQKSMGTRPSG